MILPPIVPPASGQFEAREGVALGTTAKSSPPPPEKVRKASRALRYQAHSQSREWLIAQAKSERPESYPGDVYRTADCRYVNHGDVGVNYSQQFQAAHYSGLVTCGSPWACTTCSARIQERRRHEIQQAIDWANSQGLYVFLVTFTFPHQAWQKLADLIPAQADAFKRLRKGKRWDRHSRSIGYQGLIRSLEVTHGRNGWHPHTHELWICEDKRGPHRWELTQLWESACIRAGLLDPDDNNKLGAFYSHAVDVKADMDGGAYLAKQDDVRSWGFAEEVSKAVSKAGRAKGVHPHHFLIRKAQGDSQRYIEYVKGMKGRRQLLWSRGLKDRVGITDVTDEVLANESREAADLLGLLTTDDWKLIRGNDARSELLDAAEHGGWKAVKSLLTALR